MVPSVNPSRPPLPGPALAFALALAGFISPAGAQTLEGAQGIVANLDAASGRYEVRSRTLNWVFAGQLGRAASHVSVTEGQDRLGAFHELGFSWGAPVALTGSIRVYLSRPVVLLGVITNQPLSNVAAMRFPQFSELPANLRGFSYANREFAPPSFRLEENATPWLLYDGQGRAAVLSPAANYMLASMYGEVKAGITSGLNNSVAALPAGFRHATLMALGAGVNAAWEAWGSALTELQQVHRPANDADIGLRYLGYWTDNGAEYYYNYDAKLGYAGTLLSLVQRYRDEAIPVRYLQLDSWWYYKTYTDPAGTTGKSKNERLPREEWNRYGGLERYRAHPGLFPQGLPAFQKALGLPLITHNRWIDPASPYHERYRISGFAAIDPAFWREIMAYLSSAGVLTYEQDWLNVIYEHSPALASGLEAGDAFTGGMAEAAQQRGLTLQYCMALPRHFLQGARYPNLTTIRVSGDRFGRDKWDSFLYTARLASALQIWPWTDVFMSRETDNLLLATLSAGMVGIGDRIGDEDRANLLRAVRADGVIVKPDVPLVPVDAMYTAGGTQPMIAATHTDHGALRTGYVFVYARSPHAAPVTFSPAQVGVMRAAYVYDSRSQSARRLAADEAFSFVLPPQGSGYFVVAPLARAGIALVGDTGRFVPDGRKRIAALADDAERLTATVTFAPQERSLRLFGYAAHRPSITAQAGSVGEVSFDQRTGRFEVPVFPGSRQESEAPANDPVYRAVITLRGG